MSTYEVLAQLMEDMSYPQPYRKSDRLQGGTQ
jgi:hypothetical protein